MIHSTNPAPFTVDAGPDAVVVRFLGGDLFLTEDTLPGLADLMADIAAKTGSRDLIMDFAEVDFLSSSTLGVLIRLRKKMQEQGGRLTIRGLRNHVYEVFAVTRLTAWFGIPSL